MGIIVFNGISSKDIGLEVETFPTYTIPEKEYQVYHVQGRNGDVVIDTGTYKNVTRSYEVSIATWDLASYSRTINRVSEWLHSTPSYARLEDSYDDEFYRIAYYSESVSFENLFNEAGKGTINFICKPQRFYKSGELPITFSDDISIKNDTNFPSLPKMIINKTNNESGKISINGIQIEILSGSGSDIIIDCDIQDAYYGNVNKNNYIKLLNGDFPTLKPGINEIDITSAINSVSLVPRWWTI